MSDSTTGTPSGGNRRATTSVVKNKTVSSGKEGLNPLKTISLKAALSGEVLVGDKTKKKEEKVEEEIVVDPSWNDPVTQEAVSEQWMNYMIDIQKSNPRLASIMKNHIPELINGTILSVRLKNVTQQNELNAEKTRMFGVIRSQLKNAHLSLETSIVLIEQGEKKAFTAAERAQLMAEKNPTLLKFSKVFDLDVEI